MQSGSFWVLDDAQNDVRVSLREEQEVGDSKLRSHGDEVLHLVKTIHKVMAWLVY